MNYIKMERKGQDINEVIDSMNDISIDGMEKQKFCKDIKNVNEIKESDKNNDESFIFPYSKKLKKLEKEGSSTWFTNDLSFTPNFVYPVNKNNIITNPNHTIRANSTHGIIQASPQRFNSFNKQTNLDEKYMSTVNFNNINCKTQIKSNDFFPNNFPNNSNMTLQSNLSYPSNFNSGSTFDLNQYASHYNQNCSQGYNFYPQVGYSNMNFPFPTYYTQPIIYTPQQSKQHVMPSAKSSSFKNSNNSNKTIQNNSKISSKKSKFKTKMDYENLSDDEILKIIPIICKEQAGCRYLQDKIENIPEYAEKILLPCIFNEIINVINNQFGNYLVQKMLDSIAKESFDKIKGIVSNIKYNLYKVEDNIENIATNQYGTRVIQIMINRIKEKYEIKRFVSLIESNLLLFMMDSNAYHIIIKCISSYDELYLSTLFKKMKKIIVDICVDKIGCCAIQKCIEKASLAKRNILINKITKNTMKLISDQNGNYVLLHILQFNKDENDIRSIISKIKNEGNIKVLAKQKYSANIIEKCLEIQKNADIQAEIVDLFCSKSIIRDIISDSQFGSNSKFIIKYVFFS